MWLSCSVYVVGAISDYLKAISWTFCRRIKSLTWMKRSKKEFLHTAHKSIKLMMVKECLDHSTSLAILSWFGEFGIVVLSWQQPPLKVKKSKKSKKSWNQNYLILLIVKSASRRFKGVFTPYTWDLCATPCNKKGKWGDDSLPVAHFFQKGKSRTARWKLTIVGPPTYFPGRYVPLFLLF